VDHSFHSTVRPAKINQETETLARSAQVVQALGGMFHGEVFNALQFDHKYVFGKEVGIVFPG
jgi:hypothetical protein